MDTNQRQITGVKLAAVMGEKTLLKSVLVI